MTHGIRAAAVILLGAITYCGSCFLAGARCGYLQDQVRNVPRRGRAGCHIDGKEHEDPVRQGPGDGQGAPDARLIASTANGKGKMPAYKGKLTDAQIKDVVAYMRTLEK